MPYVPLVFGKSGHPNRTTSSATEEAELRFDGWFLIGQAPAAPQSLEDQLAALTARVVSLEAGSPPAAGQPTFAVVDGHLIATMPGGTPVLDLTGLDAYEQAVDEGFVGTLPDWLLSLKGANGSPIVAGGFGAPTVANDIASSSILSNWGIDGSGNAYYTALGAVPAEAAMLVLLSNGKPGLRRIGDPDFRVLSVVSSATPTPNIDGYGQYNLTALAVNAVFAAPVGTPRDGQPLTLRITATGGPWTLGFNAIYRAFGITLPASVPANKSLYVGCRYNALAVKWDCVATGTLA